MARTFHSTHQSSGVIALLYLLLVISVAHNQQAIAKEGNIKKVSLVIRIAVFVDMSLRNHFRQNLKLNDNQEISRLLQSYIEQVEAIFSNLKSELISKIHLKFVEMRLEKFSAEFLNNSTFSGSNIDHLLDEFCQYQHKIRPRIWDLSLLLTAQDLYSEEEAQVFKSQELSSTTMGVSVVNGLDWHDLSCLIVEFGNGFKNLNLVDSQENRVYPTRGFSSAWVAAHEIAHSLGIHHDGLPFNEDCPETGYIMSSRNYVKSIATNWSSCSSYSLDNKDLSPFLSTKHDHDNLLTENDIKNLPGQLFDAQFQCKTFSEQLIQANKVSERICNESLLCSTESGQTVSIGPALEGTQCKFDGSICIKNSCILYWKDQFDLDSK